MWQVAFLLLLSTFPQFLAFKIYVVMCLGVGLFEFILLGVHWAWMFTSIRFIKFGKRSAIGKSAGPLHWRALQPLGEGLVQLGEAQQRWPPASVSAALWLEAARSHQTADPWYLGDATPSVLPVLAPASCGQEPWNMCTAAGHSAGVGDE